MKGSAPSATRHPALTLLLLVGLLLAAFCVGMFVIALYAKLTLDGADMSAVMANPAGFRQGWDFTMVSQGVLLFIGFGGAALALASISGYRWANYFAPRRPVPLWAPLTAALLIIMLLPVMSALVEWNAKTHFPAFLHDFEAWARASEDRAQVLTKYLTQFSSTGRFLIGVLVVAVVPAIAEELFFRGVIQRNLVQWFSPHLGIWLAAALFSAIHFQFFGFFPRFVLGLVLGYLYQWSGNILVPMAAHFTQNGFQLLLLYLQQRHVLGADFDPDSMNQLPWTWVAISAVISAGVLYYMYQNLLPPAPTEMHSISSGGVAVTAPETPVPEARSLDEEARRHHPGDSAVENQFSS
jgi:membrane protease YdiL (CAAX protease family)